MDEWNLYKTPFPQKKKGTYKFAENFLESPEEQQRIENPIRLQTILIHRFIIFP